METIINHIHISNFKSLKDVTLDQCRRINLIIGKPNVGKSNLLEAMSLFCLPYLKYTRKRSIQQFIRTDNDAELFFDGHVDSPISVYILPIPFHHFHFLRKSIHNVENRSCVRA